MENTIAFEGKYYAIDVDAFMKAVSSKEDNENDKQTTVTQSYGIPIVNMHTGDPQATTDSIKLISKEITESNSNVNEIMSTYRYNLINNLLNILMTPISDGNGTVILTNSASEMHFGQKLAFNTLFEMGIIYEIEFEE
jgi:hypothetical protein